MQARESLILFNQIYAALADDPLDKDKFVSLNRARNLLGGEKRPFGYSDFVVFPDGSAHPYFGQAIDESAIDAYCFRTDAVESIYRVMDLAVRSGREWTLSFYAAIEIARQPCSACGCSAGENNNAGVNGFIRIDQDKGFVPGNVAARCAKCASVEAQRKQKGIVGGKPRKPTHGAL